MSGELVPVTPERLYVTRDFAEYDLLMRIADGLRDGKRNARFIGRTAMPPVDQVGENGNGTAAGPEPR